MESQFTVFYSNEFLLIFTTFIIMSLILVCYKLGRIYLISLTAVCLVLSNLIGPKIVSVFGFAISVGTSIFAALPLATDLLTEKYGKKHAKIAVYTAFLGMIMLILISRPISLLGNLAFSQTSSDAVNSLLNSSLRLMIASPLAYLIWQIVDIMVYFYVKKITGEKMLWLRNNTSTFIAQAGSTFTFFGLAFIGTGTPWIEISVVTVGFYWIIAIIDTGFVYAARLMRPLDLKN